MSKDINKIKIKAIKPDYYDRFQCLGSDCKNSCCAGWGISLTKKEYTKISGLPVSKRLEKEKGKLFKRVREGATDINYVHMCLEENGRCKFLRSDDLCHMQYENGHEILPVTCQEFPRELLRTAEGMVHFSMGMGCEAVTKLLLEYPKGVPLKESFTTIPPQFRYNSLLTEQQAEERPALKYCSQINLLGNLLLSQEGALYEERLFTLAFVLHEIDKLEQEKKEDAIPFYIQSVIQDMGRSQAKLFEEISGNSKLNLYGALRMITLFLGGDRSLKPELQQILNGFGAEIRLVEVSDTNTEQDAGQDLNIEISTNEDKIKQAEENFKKFFESREFLLSNIAANWWDVLHVPFKFLNRSVWENTMLYICVLTLFKYTVMGHLDENSDLEQFLDISSRCSRAILHNIGKMEEIVEDLVKSETDTLAHMAIMIKG